MKFTCKRLSEDDQTLLFYPKCASEEKHWRPELKKDPSVSLSPFCIHSKDTTVISSYSAISPTKLNEV